MLRAKYGCAVLLGAWAWWGAVANAQEVVFEDFEDGNVAPLSLEAGSTTEAGIEGRRFGNNFLRIFHHADESNAYLSYTVNQPENWQSVDVEFRTRFPTGIPFPDWGTVKQSRVADGRGGELLTIVILYDAETDGYYLGYQSGVDGNSSNGNIPITLRRNRWDTIRYRAVFNPRGQSTGIFQIWFNGALVADRSDVDFFQGETTPVVPSLVLVGMNANVFDKEYADEWVPFNRDLDDVRIQINP